MKVATHLDMKANLDGKQSGQGFFELLDSLTAMFVVFASDMIHTTEKGLANAVGPTMVDANFTFNHDFKTGTGSHDGSPVSWAWERYKWTSVYHPCGACQYAKAIN